MDESERGKNVFNSSYSGIELRIDRCKKIYLTKCISYIRLRMLYPSVEESLYPEIKWFPLLNHLDRMVSSLLH